MDRVDYWKSQGAEVSDTVKSLIKRKKAAPEAVVEAVAEEAPVDVEEEAPVEAEDAEAVVEEATAEAVGSVEDAGETETAEAPTEELGEEEDKAPADA